MKEFHIINELRIPNIDHSKYAQREERIVSLTTHPRQTVEYSDLPDYLHQLKILKPNTESSHKSETGCSELPIIKQYTNYLQEMRQKRMSIV